MFGDDEFGEFGGPGEMDHVAGPLIGGGATQVGILATKLLLKSKPGALKWAPLIGTVVGAGVSGALMFSPKHRNVGLSGLVTAAIIGVPRQIEELLVASGTLKDSYLGVTVPEREMAGYGFGDDQYQMQGAGFGAGDIQLLGGGGAGLTGSLGVTVPEREMSGSGMGGPDVELLGAGFGSNFLSSQ